MKKILLPCVIFMWLVAALLATRPHDEPFVAGDGVAHLLGQATGGRGEAAPAPGPGSDGSGGAGLHFDANGLPIKGNPAVAVPLPQQVAGLLNRANAVCGKGPDEYVIDCMIVYFRQALSATPQSGQYAEVHRVLQDTVKQLEKVVKANLDETKPAIRVVTGGTSGSASARMRAIKPESVPRAKAQAASIVAEAETQLLRSASNSDTRLEYVRIAEAMGSNKVLLRS